jgi:serine/threonine protein kinase
MPLPARRAYPDPDEFQGTASGRQTETQEPVTSLDRIGQYRIRKLIGRGGMGAVYEATHVRLGKSVALKVLPRTAAVDPDQLVRFEREVRAVGKLDHPNVVRATDAGEYDGVPYLAMDLLDGVDFATTLRALGPLPLTDACEVVRQAALGLAHAHECGIVHRDVKPSNLMVTTGGLVKVLDLGLAVFVTAVGRIDERITGVTVLGTFDYMAPEQWVDPSAVTDRADVYALGCLLFQGLIGRPPFGGAEHDSPHAKRRAHQHTVLPAITTLRPEVSDDLANLIRRMTAKRPEERPTAAVSAEALARLIPASPPLGKLVTRTRLAPEGGFTDGKPTAIAPLKPDTLTAPPTVATFDHPTAPFSPPVPRGDPGGVRTWELNVAVVVLTLFVVGLIAVVWGIFQ